MSNKISKSICKGNIEALQKRFEEASKGKTKDLALENVRPLITTPDGKFSAEKVEQLKKGLFCQNKGALGEIFWDSDDTAMKVAMSGGGEKLILGKGAGGMGFRRGSEPATNPSQFGVAWDIPKLDTGGGRGLRPGFELETRKRSKVKSAIQKSPKIEEEKFLALEKAEKWVNKSSGVAFWVRDAYETLLRWSGLSRPFFNYF